MKTGVKIAVGVVAAIGIMGAAFRRAAMNLQFVPHKVSFSNTGAINISIKAINPSRLTFPVPAIDFGLFDNNDKFLGTITANTMQFIPATGGILNAVFTPAMNSIFSTLTSYALGNIPTNITLTGNIIIGRLKIPYSQKVATGANISGPGTTVELPDGYVLVSERSIQRKNEKLQQLKNSQTPLIVLPPAPSRYRATERKPQLLMLPLALPEPSQEFEPRIEPIALDIPPAQNIQPQIMEPVQPSQQLVIRDIALKDIQIYLTKFQNRKNPYSEQSVNRIIEAVETGQFRIQEFDPVLLWRSPDAQLYMLSGHSRLEAFHRLCDRGMSNFCTIPSKVIAVSEAEAKDIALRSNTLSTKETDTERATIYRNMIQIGKPNKEVIEAAKRTEGKDANRILAYAYLSEDGKTITALKALEAGDPTSQTIIKAIAQWVGEARMKFPMLTDAHEDEIYTWLQNGAFGKQYSNMRDYLQKIAQVVNNRTEFGVFRADEPLNLFNTAAKNFSEQQFDKMMFELRDKMQNIEQGIKAKTNDYKSRGATSDQIYTVLEKDYAVLSRLRNELTVLMQRKKDIANQPQTASLFGLKRYSIGATVITQKFKNYLG